MVLQKQDQGLLIWYCKTGSRIINYISKWTTVIRMNITTFRSDLTSASEGGTYMGTDAGVSELLRHVTTRTRDVYSTPPPSVPPGLTPQCWLAGDAKECKPPQWALTASDVSRQREHSISVLFFHRCIFFRFFKTVDDSIHPPAWQAVILRQTTVEEALVSH